MSIYELPIIIFWSKVTKALGYIWISIGMILILIGYLGVYLEKGFPGVRTLLSPFNIINYIVVVATLAPGWVLLTISEKLKK